MDQDNPSTVAVHVALGGVTIVCRRSIGITITCSTRTAYRADAERLAQELAPLVEAIALDTEAALRSILDR